jgi:hypothetical protein
MSELDDLADIADQNAFWRGNGNHIPRGGRKPSVVCGSPDHMKGENVRVYRKGKNGKIRTVCKLCDKVRKRGPRYSAEGYPL